MNVVITGASKGIGKALALKFAQNGHNVAICSRGVQQLKETEHEINPKFPHVETLAYAADISKNTGAEAFKNAIVSKWKQVDILINNAGVFLPGHLKNEAVNTLPTLIENNLYSAYYMTKALLPSIIVSHQKHIFNICSIASLDPYQIGSSYSISKYALLVLSKNLREEIKNDLVKVTAVLPGPTLTDSWKDEEVDASKFVTTDDIASIIYNTSQLSASSVVEDIVIRPLSED